MRKKLIVIWMLAILPIMAVNSLAMSQITVSAEHIPLKTLLRQLEQSRGYTFFYTDQVNTSMAVNVDVKGGDISQVMQQALLGTDIAFTVTDMCVSLYRKENKTASQQPPHEITVRGVVTESDGIPIPGVNVFIKGSTKGVVSDANGRFTIIVPSSAAVLVFSFVGYAEQEITVGAQTTLTVVMQEAASEIEEVAIVAYGTQKKESITGAISSVQSDELKISSSANVASALSGRISGLTATQISGQPGKDDVRMWLRGSATTNGTQPLIMIDGVPRDNIRTLDPNEIESVSVLKDASATAVFGVRGANGVVMITTKRGKKGDPELSISATQSFASLTREPDRVHSVEYMQLRNQAMSNDGQLPYFTEAIIDKFRNPLKDLSPSDPDYEKKKAALLYMYPDHDYYREMINKWVPQTVINANLTGGTDNLSYFINVGYTHQAGNLNTEPEEKLGYDPSVKLDRYNFRSNLDYKITSNLKAFLNLGTYIEKVNMPAVGIMYTGGQDHMMTDLFYQTQSILPISPGPYTIAGYGFEEGLVLNPTYLDAGSYLDRSPFEIMNYRGYLNETRANLNSTLGMQWDLAKGLNIKAQVSFDSWGKTVEMGETTARIYQSNVNPNTDQLSYSETRSNASALSLSEGVSAKYTINAQASINYARKFGKHDVGGMFLGQRDYWKSEGAAIPFNVIGLAFRATYNYDSRYFAEFNFGYNGSEQFAPGNRFGKFPAGSVGWVVSNESFLKDNKWLTFLKLRGSLGKVGSDVLGGTRFLYLDNITVAGGPLGSIAQGRYINEGLLGNTRLQWETSLKYNIGVDVHLWHDLKMSVDVFQENRSNILMTRAAVPSLQGVPLGNIPKVNMGKVVNRGFELEASYSHDLTKDLTISLKGNFSYTHNERTAMDEVPRDASYAYRYRSTGFTIGQNWGYEIDWDQDGGYWTPVALQKAKDAVAVDPNRTGVYEFGNPREGDFVYKDANGDGKIDDKDEVPIGYGSTPRVTWGTTLMLNYKGFDLTVFFQGLSHYSQQRASQGVFETTSKGTYFPYMLKAWTPERWSKNEEITYPALSTGNNTNHRANSFFVMDRSFVRLKNIELGYTLSLKEIGLSEVRIFVSGQNVFLWSPRFRATHLDPEVDSPIGYPNARMFSVGFNVKF